jgi:hypothetical protein
MALPPAVTGESQGTLAFAPAAIGLQGKVACRTPCVHHLRPSHAASGRRTFPFIAELHTYLRGFAAEVKFIIPMRRIEKTISSRRRVAIAGHQRIPTVSGTMWVVTFPVEA